LLDLRRIESKLRPSTLGIRLSLSAAFLRRSLKSAEAPDFLENTFRIKLVLKPFESAVDRFTLTDYDFWHIFS
jgi:hypothetical protein